LPADRVKTKRTLARARIGALPFVEEALGWLPGTSRGITRVPAAHAGNDELPISPQTRRAEQISARILVVDDNADMRGYLSHLLGDHWEIETASDGIVALECVHRCAPDLVIADVMMPGMDGFALLRELRENPAASEVPVMLLSARAGEEA